MDGHVTEVTERSGRDTDVTGRVRRLQRFAEFTERCTEGVEICGGLRGLRWWCGNAG